MSEQQGTSNGDRNAQATRTIGWLSRQADVRVETIRFYEREGLLPEAARDPSSKYRLFGTQAVQRLRFIRRAQELGFTLAETRELLAFEHVKQVPCEEVRRRAEDKLDDLETRIADLERMREALAELVEACRSMGRAEDCPIIEALGGRAVA